ncbi:hypothetical protein DFJ73DRAFT_962747 [Zopfochytrium polystomum]|nr:hypothetical protein DFJ73DRAFT_962747 [Zopfochytrium polystomum]
MRTKKARPARATPATQTDDEGGDGDGGDGDDHGLHPGRSRAADSSGSEDGSDGDDTLIQFERRVFAQDVHGRPPPSSEQGPSATAEKTAWALPFVAERVAQASGKKNPSKQQQRRLDLGDDPVGAIEPESVEIPPAYTRGQPASSSATAAAETERHQRPNVSASPQQKRPLPHDYARPSTAEATPEGEGCHGGSDRPPRLASPPIGAEKAKLAAAETAAAAAAAANADAFNASNAARAATRIAAAVVLDASFFSFPSSASSRDGAPWKQDDPADSAGDLTFPPNADEAGKFAATPGKDGAKGEAWRPGQRRRKRAVLLILVAAILVLAAASVTAAYLALKARSSSSNSDSPGITNPDPPAPRASSAALNSSTSTVGDPPPSPSTAATAANRQPTDPAATADTASSLSSPSTQSSLSGSPTSALSSSPSSPPPSSSPTSSSPSSTSASSSSSTSSSTTTTTPTSLPSSGINGISPDGGGGSPALPPAIVSLSKNGNAQPPFRLFILNSDGEVTGCSSKSAKGNTTIQVDCDDAAATDGDPSGQLFAVDDGGRWVHRRTGLCLTIDTFNYGDLDPCGSVAGQLLSVVTTSIVDESGRCMMPPPLPFSAGIVILTCGVFQKVDIS